MKDGPAGARPRHSAPPSLVAALLAALLAALVAGPARAALEVRPESTVVDEGGSFRLVIRADPANAGGDLDLAPLQRDFDILAQQTSSQFRSFNGRIESSLDWVLTLRPKRTGLLRIPPLALGNEKTRPVTISVRPLDPGVRAELARRVFFETRVSTRRPYVDAQVVVKRALYYVEGAQLYGELPAAVEVEGAIVQRLTEPQHRAVERDGERYGVIEESFVLFPERSGTLEIPSVSLTASVAVPRRDGRTRRTELKVASEPVALTVRPIPSNYPPDAPWLPAANLEILEDMPDLDRPLDVGTPRRRALIVRAEGATAAMIPPLEPHYPDEIRTYPDVPELLDNPTADGIVATRAQSTSLVATRPGTVELPALSLTWWDTTADRVRVTTLPARPVEVVGAPMRVESTQPPATARTARAPDREHVPTAHDADLAAALPIRDLLVVAAGGLAVALTLTFALRTRRAVQIERASPLRRFGRDPERRAYRRLRTACRSRGPKRIRTALEAWLRTRTCGPLEAALRDFTAADPHARAAVAALNRALYGDDGTEFDPGPLLQAVATARRPRRSSAPRLPPLYPRVHPDLRA